MGSLATSKCAERYLLVRPPPPHTRWTFSTLWNVFEITYNRASRAGTHLEAAAQRFFNDMAAGIHEQNDEGLVDGVAVGAECDAPADALEGLRACDLCQS